MVHYVGNLQYKIYWRLLVFYIFGEYPIVKHSKSAYITKGVFNVFT